MLPDLKGRRFVVGFKQSAEAVASGTAEKAYVAEDADERIITPFRKLCAENGVAVFNIETKKLLGKVCGINVSASCAVVLK